MNSSDRDEPARSALTRRSVIRAGAHAAWAAPAITMATAAPAFAMSTPTQQATLGISQYALAAFPDVRNGPVGGYTGYVTVTSDIPVTGVAVTVSIPLGSQRLSSHPRLDPASVTNGWVGGGGGGTYTFTFGAKLEGFSTFNFKLYRTTANLTPGSINVVWTTATVSAPGALSASSKDDIV